jgi:chromosome segregation protein
MLRAVAEDEARQKQQTVEQELADLQAQLTAARRSAQEAQQALHAAQVEALKLAQAQARFEERSAQIDRDLAELLRQVEAEAPASSVPRATAGCSASVWATVRERVERAIDLHRQKDMALRDARAVETQLGREVQEAGFSERECLSKLDDNHRAGATASSQLQRIEAETVAARTEVSGISDTVLQEQLHAALDARQVKESALAERRNVLESMAADLRGLDEQRLRLEQGLSPLRDRINDLRLKAQAAQLSEEQFRERLAEVRIVSEEDEAPFQAELAAGGAERLKDSVLQGDIARLTAEIEAWDRSIWRRWKSWRRPPSARASSTRSRPTWPRPSAPWKTPSAASTAKRASSCRRPTTRSITTSARCSRNSSAVARHG